MNTSQAPFNEPCTWPQRPVASPGEWPLGSAVGLADGAGWAPEYHVHAYDPHARTVEASLGAHEVNLRTGHRRLSDLESERRFPAPVASLRKLTLTHRRGPNTHPLHSNRCTHPITDGLFDPSDAPYDRPAGHHTSP